MNAPVIFRDLGRQPYLEIWDAMRRFADGRDAASDDEIWFVEHPPVFTLGLNGKAEHLLAPGDIPVLQVDRGGQVTYHGPGQLVGYILMDLRRRHWGVRRLVSGIEQALVALLAGYDIVAHARPDAPGVYVGEEKIAALGLRVRRGGSYHGFSLNLAMNLEPFTRINPCGYAQLAVTQVSAYRPEITRTQVIGDLTSCLLRALEYQTSGAIVHRQDSIP